MARKHRVPLVYVNQFGGNDDLVFDGRSCAFDAARRADRARPLVRRATSSSAISTQAAPIGAAGRPRRSSRKSGARWCSARATTRASAASQRVVLGLSGGIDSALTAAIAAEALGADQRARRADAVAVLEPRQHRRLAASSPRNLGIETLTLPIDDGDAGDGRTLARGVRRDRRATSPRRTSRRASAATC